MSFEQDIKKWAKNPNKWKWQQFSLSHYAWEDADKIPSSMYLRSYNNQFRIVEIKQEVYQREVKIPAPETKKPKLDSYYFIPDITCLDGFTELRWDNTGYDNTMLKDGLVYLNGDYAAKRTKAMKKLEYVTT